MNEISLETEGVVWDLDGTLLNSFGIFKIISEQLATEFQFNIPSEDTFLANYHGSLEESLSGIFEGDISDEALGQMKDSFLHHQDEAYSGDINGFLFSDAVALAQRIHAAGIRQALLTNRGHINRGSASPLSIAQRSSLDGLFDRIVSGDEVEARKPDRRSIDMILQEWNVKASNLLVIGDQHVDAQLGLNLGAHAVIVCREGITNASTDLQSLADQDRDISICNSFDDVGTNL